VATYDIETAPLFASLQHIDVGALAAAQTPPTGD
jgi:hypothetical protein